MYYKGFPRGLDSKKTYQQCRRHRVSPWVGKIPLRRKWQPTPVFLPGESNGQSSLMGYRVKYKRIVLFCQAKGYTAGSCLKNLCVPMLDDFIRSLFFSSVQFSSVAQSCPTLCDPMNHSTPGLPVHHQLLEFTQTHVHRVSDAIQPSHSLPSPSPPAPNPSQHQSLFQ